MICYCESHRVVIIIDQIRGGHDGEATSRHFRHIWHFIDDFAVAAGPTNPANRPGNRRFSHLARSRVDVDGDIERLRQPDRRPDPHSHGYCLLVPMRLHFLHPIASRARIARLKSPPPLPAVQFGSKQNDFRTQIKIDNTQLHMVTIALEKLSGSIK